MTDRLGPSDYADLYARFERPLSATIDCGRFCSALNGGEPVCCSTQHAVPIVDRAEWRHLKAATDLWHRFKPYDGATRRMVDELHRDCVAIECKGAAACERANRTIACRAFPFFPYVTAQRIFVGLAGYDDFEDRCWVLSNLGAVDRAFVQEMAGAFAEMFTRSARELEVFFDHSVTVRRRFSRSNRPILLLSPSGDVLKVLPRSGGRIVPAGARDLVRHGPYVSRRAYAAAVREAGGSLPDLVPFLVTRRRSA